MRTRPRGPTVLAAGRRLAIYVIGLGLWASGALWLVFHYFLTVRGRFGPAPHPLEPWWMKLHGAFAFATVWVLGLLWGVHILNGWYSNRRRGSGAVLLGGLGLLTVSGYLLYYLGDDNLRAVVSYAHWIVGLAAPTAFFAHRFSWLQGKSAASGRPVALHARAPAPHESVAGRDICPALRSSTD